ncbi:hypothetical protein [Burkholderia sp. JP2-270]|uniref:hypothetical protein n=1 Tax=Burkholderia sp. JP2-270 TaxID=2217913 RepID=UPI001EF7929A|nr:hypothetical protein [Burkholderia sp. JP2-270]
MSQALEQARASGCLQPAFELKLVVRRGAYICGEETSLLNALEGHRPQVRPRPPQITQDGLFGAPTLVQNVASARSSRTASSARPEIPPHGAPRRLSPPMMALHLPGRNGRQA